MSEEGTGLITGGFANSGGGIFNVGFVGGAILPSAQQVIPEIKFYPKS